MRGFRLAAAMVMAGALWARAQNPPPEPDEHDHADHSPYPELALTVKVEEERDKSTGDLLRTIRGSGKCGYPEGTTLILEARLLGSPGYLNKRHATFVNPDGTWEAALDKLGRQVYKGMYEVRVAFDPAFQPASVMAALDRKNQNGQVQYKSTEVRFGTPEEEAREKADVDQMYARAFAKAKAIYEDTEKAYAEHLKKADRLAWGDFVTDVNDRVVRGDRELGEFRKSRDNLRDHATYEKIASLYAISSNMLYPALTSALGIDGGRASEEERATARSMLDNLKRTIGELDATIGKVEIDPNWKPLPAVPVRVERPQPPVGPLGGTDSKPDPGGPKPIGGDTAPRSRFGVAELGIGLALMCALAMLVVMLKRK
ncbi:MAG: hypothetical protein IT452_15960 [Planctomycetia bacterium]|nr:hypothetical protein [Planctomycetia bacterium]